MSLSFPRISVTDIPGKGQGLIALEDIPRGTLIVAESPLMAYPFSSSPSPSDEAVKFLLSFPCEEDKDPILGRLRHFLPLVGSSTARQGLFATICKANHICASPLDGPNAAYFWDNESGKERASSLLLLSLDLP